MASGTINGSTGNEYIDAKIEWSTTASGMLGYTTVTAALYYKRNNTGYTTYGTGTFSITIDGKTKSESKTLTITEKGWVKAVEMTLRIDHVDTMTIGISASGSIPDTSLSSTSVSGSITLIGSITADEGSTINSLSCDTTYFNGEMTYKYTPKSKSHYNRCNISLNLNGEYIAVKSINLGNQSASQQTATVTLSESELSIIYNKLPNTAKGTLRFTLRTYVDSEYSVQKDKSTYKEITLNIPNDSTTKPSVSASLTPSHTLTGDFASLYVQGKSKVKATITASGKYGATITERKMVVESKTYDSGDSFTSGYISGKGTIAVNLTATDSRGFSQTITKNITVIAYSDPKVVPASGESSIICARCDANGNLSESGTYLKIKAKRSYSLCTINGVQKNFCYIRYRYKPEGGSYSSWTTILATTATSDEVTTGALLANGLLLTSSYVVQIGVVDTIGEPSAATINIPTDKVYTHRAGSKRSLGIGEYVDEPNLISIAEDIAVRAKGGFEPIEIPEFTDFDTLTKPNFYYSRYTYVPGYVNCPISVQTTFSLEVIAMGKDGQLLQRITRCSAEATVYERQYYSQEWHEWECVNPPMVLDQEYRTTERYMGKPVYTKLIYCDVLPNTTYKLFPHGAAVSQAIRCVGQMSDGNSLPFRFNATNYVEIYAGPDNVVIYAGNDKTNRSAYAQMWYIKD